MMQISSMRSIRMQSKNVLENKDNSKVKLTVIRSILLVAALALIIYGLSCGGFKDVMSKAIRICYECIGIG